MGKMIKTDTECPTPYNLESTNIRRYLSQLRQRWADHSPTNPFCLAEELEPKLTVSDFCVLFLMTQRARRYQVRHEADMTHCNEP
jgi:hypothetical protein